MGECANQSLQSFPETVPIRAAVISKRLPGPWRGRDAIRGGEVCSGDGDSGEELGWFIDAERRV